MSPAKDIETRLDELGSSLRQRPALADRILQLVRQEPVTPKAPTGVVAPVPKQSWRRYRSLALLLAVTAAVLLLAMLVLPIGPQVSLAQVTEKLRAQKWIHAVEKGDRPGRMEMWLSAEHQISAMKLGPTVRFANGKEQAKYEYAPGRRRLEIWKFPLGDKLEREVVPWNSIDKGKEGIGPWLFGNEEILRQERTEIVENGKRFVEYELLMGGERKIVLRVDPVSRLPLYLVMPAIEKGGAPRRWEFDYPDDGPRDIYSLGVPRDAPLNDLMPQPEMAKMLEGMAESRRSIGDYRMTVKAGSHDFSYIVWRKGERWRVDSCFARTFEEPQPVGPGWDEWWNKQLENGYAWPLYVCDGNQVMFNAVSGSREELRKRKWEPEKWFGPSELLDPKAGTMGGSQNFVREAFPDLAPQPGDAGEFVKEPTDGPPGCVLVTRSGLLTDGKVWYLRSYLDPKKGYAQIQHIQFGLRPDQKSVTPENAESYSIVFLEDYQHSPQGFWYPGRIRVVSFARKEGQSPDEKPVQTSEEVRLYEFNFEADIPDSLFLIAGGK
jgi:hypothetical protein